MKYLICYDVSSDKCRRRIAKYLESFAHRLQYSVFMAQCTSEQIEKVKNKLFGLGNGQADIILTIVPLCQSCEAKIWQFGKPLEVTPLCVIA